MLNHPLPPNFDSFHDGLALGTVACPTRSRASNAAISATPRPGFMFVSNASRLHALPKDEKRRAKRHVMINHLHTRTQPQNAVVRQPTRVQIRFRASSASRLCRDHKPQDDTTPDWKSTGSTLPSPSLAKPMYSSQYRCGIQERFCALFFPASHPWPPEIFEVALDRHDHSINPSNVVHSAVRFAGDAFTTLISGVVLEDLVWIRAAVERFGKALCLLQLAIDRKDAMAFPENFALAVYLAVKFEYLIATNFNDSAWQIHTEVMLKFLRHVMDQSILDGLLNRFLSVGGQWIAVTSSLYALGKGLLERRRLDWIPGNVPPTSLILDVPSRLELLDRCGDMASLQNAQLQALQLRAEIGDAMTAWTRSIPCPTHDKVPIASFPEITARLFLPLTTAITFCSAEAALTLRMFWTSIIVLNEALLNRCIDLTQSLRAELAQELALFANNICQMIVFFAAEPFGLCGNLALMEPLHFVHGYFERSGDVGMAAWCQRVKDNYVLGMRVKRILNVTSSTT